MTSIVLIVLGLLCILSIYTIFEKSNNEGLIGLFVVGIAFIALGVIIGAVLGLIRWLS